MNKFLTYVMSVLIISAAAFIVFWFLIEDPYRKEMDELEAQIKEEQSKIEQHKKDQKDIKKLEEDIEKIKQDIFRILCKARGRSLEQFLREIEDDADAAAIKLESIRIESVVTKELNSRIPLDFNISGPYFILYDFLQKLETAGKSKGKLDFSQSQLSIAQESKTEKLPKLTQISDSKRTKYNPGTDMFPRLRVTLNGEIIIIDDTQLEKYKTANLSKCPDEPGAGGGTKGPDGGD
ncbi:MAG: type 4a pilus biogenesis protein PilO [Candidatus Riflebacteria bacterium]|nr:type 4a pilus biogenesis protein PilO [Candidatus Riflebacteria bacterium]